jgi:predicted transcriptional regulator
MARIHDTTFSIRLPQELAQVLESIAQAAKTTRAQVLRTAADEYVSRLATKER